MSTSAKLFSHEELMQILRKSQANNKINNLSGMLLYSEGSFVQVLEGDERQLKETYFKILKDPRHKKIIKIAEGKLDDRIFPYWSMGFKVTPTSELAQFDAFVYPKEQKLWENKSYHPALSILKTFADNNVF